MSNKKYVLHDPHEEGFCLSRITKDKEAITVSSRSKDKIMRFSDMAEAEKLAYDYDMEVVEEVSAWLSN